MNARDIIKLAAQLYVYDALKKKITILTNIQKGKDFNESCQALGILVDLNKKRLAT